jgi:hypothetical protein
MSEVRKANGAENAMIDIVKLLASVLVIYIHAAPLRDVLPVLDFFIGEIIGRLAVPFFIVVSSYLFYQRMANVHDSNKFLRLLVSYEKRPLTLLLVWLCIYLPILASIGYFSSLHSVLFLVKRSLFDGFYRQFWYLTAMIFAMPLSFFLTYKCKCPLWLLNVIALLLYSIGVIGHSYGHSPVFENMTTPYFDVFLTFRNGLFFSFPFCILGYEMNIKQSKTIRKKPLLVSLFVSLALMIVEAFIVRFLGYYRNYGMYLSLIPCTICICLLCFKYSMPRIKPEAAKTKLRNKEHKSFLIYKIFGRFS